MNAKGSMKSWETELNKMGFLKKWHKDIYKKVYTLKPPLKLRFSERAIEMIRKKYHPRFEGGGILLTKPALKNGDKILEVKKVKFLKNLSSTPEKEFRFDKSEIFRVWKENSEADKEYYVPIHFHSHSLIDLEKLSDMRSTIASLVPLSTSEKDQETSLGLDIRVNELNFLIPSALVVKSEIVEKHIIIGFYGGGITPTNFTEYMAKVTGQTMKEIWDMLKAWVKEDPNRIWILMSLGLLLGIPVALRPKQAIPLIFVIFIILLTSQVIPLTKQEGKYFGILKEGLIIEIPEYTPTF